MKILLMTLGLLSLNVYAQNFPANHCEVFVDKVATLTGPHQAATVHFFIKTLNSRLDSPIKEVGFHYHVTTHYSLSPVTSPWRDEVATVYNYAKDYFYIDLNIAHEYGFNDYVGSFYVKTTKGTTYWLKTKDGRDMDVTRSTFDWIVSMQNGLTNSLDPKQAMATQNSELSYFNPQNCY